MSTSEVVRTLTKALRLDKNIFIEASAGAGKTFTLTKRYCAILDDFAKMYQKYPNSPKKGPANILVITFTRKAASEMTGRIFEDLKCLLLNQKLKDMPDEFGSALRTAPVPYKQWIEANFQDNSISTIDSFCTGILRNYAYLTGCDYDFRVEEEIRSQYYFDRELDQFLRDKSAENNPNIKDIFGSVSAGKLKKIISYLYDNRLYLNDWFADMNRIIQDGSEHELLMRWEEALTPDIPIDTILEHLREMTSYRSSVMKHSDDKGFVKLQSIQNALDLFPVNESPTQQKIYLIREILQNFLTNNATAFAAFPGNKSNWQNPDDLLEIKNRIYPGLCSILKDYTESLLYIPNDADVKSISLIRPTLAVYYEFVKRMENFQKSRKYLTFNDIILKTKDLLESNEQIRKELSDKYCHILFDEFQDTNDPRWQIIKLIGDKKKGQLREQGLFLVGDRKQSIYGFQQADVTVMDSIKKIFKPEEIIEQNHNFRSSGHYVGSCINPLFESLFPADEENRASWEPPFYPTVCVSPLKDVNIPEKAVTICRLNHVPSAENDAAAAALAAEMAEKMLTWWDETGKFLIPDHDGPVIGLLLRSFKHIGSYTSAFARKNIKLEIVSGNGLFARQEIGDLFHLISFLINPHDDLALLSLMRSPWLALDDNSIHRLKHRNKDESIFSYILKDDYFRKTSDELNLWMSLCRDRYFPDLLEDILSDNLRELLILGESEGERRLANLDLGMTIIRSLMDGGMSVRETREWFRYQIDQEKAGEEAQYKSDAQVRMMTIHKSKGLQFPMVMVSDMNRKPNKDSGFITHAKIGKTTEVALNITDDTNKKAGLLTALREQQKKEEMAEELRVFYVAVTRARFAVSFLGCFEDEEDSSLKKHGWWNRFINPFITAVKSDPELSASTDISVMDWNLLKEELAGKSLADKNFSTIKWQEPSIDKTKKQRYLLTPHDIMDAICPEQASNQTHDRESDIFSRQYGVFFHKVMEEKWFENLTAAEAWLKAEMPEMPVKKSLDLLADDLNRMNESDYFHKINESSPETILTELTLNAHFKNRDLHLILKGVPDLLWITDSEWILIDYKTDKDKSRLDKYKIQIQCYQEMINNLYGKIPRGLIWFVRMNDIVDVPYEKDILNKLDFVHEPLLYDHHEGMADPDHVNIICNHVHKTKLLVLCPAKTETEEIRHSLINRRLYHPGHQIISWQELLRSRTFPGKGMDPVMQLMIFYDMLNHEKNEMSGKGTASRISDAFRNFELYGLEPVDAVRDVFYRFRSLAESKGLMTDAKIARWLLHNHPYKDYTIIVTGWYQHSPVYNEFLDTLKKDAQYFELCDKSWNAGLGSEQIQELPETVVREVTICRSVEEEVRTLMREICACSDRQTYGRFHIAVSNPGIYYPIIRRLADEYSVPVRFSTRISVKKLPAGELLINILNLTDYRDNPDWDMIASVLLHPLKMPTRQAFLFDACVRKRNPRYFLNFLKEDDPETYPEIRKDILAFLNNFRIEQKRSLAGVNNYVNFLKSEIRKMQLIMEQSGILHNDNFKALDKINAILDQLIPAFTLTGLKPDMNNVTMYLRERINTLEISPSEETDGIPVTGYLDAVNLCPDRMWILGLNHNDFPALPDKNPFQIGQPFNPWFMSKHMVNRWIRLKNVRFLCSKTYPDGTVTEPSILLRSFSVKSPDIITDPGRRPFYSQYLNKLIIAAPDDYRVRRFNAQQLMKGFSFDISGFELPESYRYDGTVTPDLDMPFRLSVTNLETLIRCPMKYWFKFILKVCPMDSDTSLQDILDTGTIVHKILETFGKRGGFQLSPQKGIEIMKSVVQDILKEENRDPDKDAWYYQQFSFILKGLENPHDGGKLGSLIRENYDLGLSVCEASFEQTFGDGREGSWKEFTHDSMINLLIHGKIDKVFADTKGKRILLSDYKTGTSSQFNLVKAGLAVQPLIYYLKAKQEYPGYDIVFVYEYIPKENDPYKMSGEAGDAGDKNCFITDRRKKFLRLNVPDVSGDNVLTKTDVDAILYQAEASLREGRFRHAKPEHYKDVCKYCEFVFTCRKE
jgi:ATP-dependent exoDNAse (exonuclease V) beta subunit